MRHFASFLLTILLSNGNLLTSSGTSAVRENVAPVPADLLIATHGDSITKYENNGLNNYAVVLGNTITTNLGTHPRLKPRGINGSSWNYAWSGETYTGTLTTDAPLAVDPLLSANDGGKALPASQRWLIVFAGTNGMNGGLGAHSAATEYANFKTYIAARVSAGWQANRIVVCTMLPRTGQNESIRATYNASLVGDDAATGYRVARLDQNANIGAGGQDTNLTYFYDGTHPTAAGQAIIAGIIYGAMYP